VTYGDLPAIHHLSCFMLNAFRGGHEGIRYTVNPIAHLRFWGSTALQP
jgi:hypothetical protein